MQRSARIGLINRKFKASVHKRKIELEKRSDWRTWLAEQRYAFGIRGQHIKEERQARREDWLAGPLAPDRNIGKVRGLYGAVDAGAFQISNVPKHARSTPQRLTHGHIREDGSVPGRLAFKGKSIIGNVIENDRVVVVEGPPKIKGRIGLVKAIDHEAESVTLKDINLADIKVSAQQKIYAQIQGGESPLFDASELPIPMKDVRLVCDIEDPRTREKRAVIIRHVHADGPYSARSPQSSWPSHTRYATGTGHLTRDGEDIRLDWPEVNDAEVPRRQNDDTSRDVVEKNTWKPSMSYSPMGYPSRLVGFENGTNESPDRRYVAGLPPKDSDVELPEQRLGLHGFVNPEKLAQRRRKIAAGIAAEISSYGGGVVRSDDNVVHLRKKMLEDARALWWKERQLLSPASEVAKKAAEAQKQQRETKLPQLTRNDAHVVVEPELLGQLQTLALKDRYRKADHRLSKRLAKQNTDNPKFAQRHRQKQAK